MGKALIVSLVIILGINFLGMGLNWFEEFPWLDSALHFCGGIWVAATFLWFFNSPRLQTSPVYKALFAVSFVMLIGILWEFAEVAFLNSLMAHIFHGPNLPATLSDTLEDLLFDLIGGITFAVLYLRSYFYEIFN